ncbi:MAG: hypothetical protein LBH12_02655 [Dysgonamonadaceae bacterium]|jgi:hypothetical protein|nr:hypothetical protein [Dysgonamonadaceae bacterium]
MKSLLRFIRTNKRTLAGMVLGTILAYFYWKYFGIRWGTYPLSSECWVNCVYGSLFGGFIACLTGKT